MWWEGQLLSWWRSRWNAFILVPVVTLSHTLREWPAGNISAASRVFQHGHTRSRKVAVTTETPSGMFSISQMDDILLILIDVSFFSVWSWSPQPTSQSLSSRLFSIYLLFSEAQGIFQGFVCVCVWTGCCFPLCSFWVLSPSLTKIAPCFKYRQAVDP